MTTKFLRQHVITRMPSLQSRLGRSMVHMVYSLGHATEASAEKTDLAATAK